MKRNKLINKFIFFFMCVLLFTHTISIADSIEIIKNESDDFSMLGEYYFFGTLIGKISNLDRFSNKEYISFQAENTVVRLSCGVVSTTSYPLIDLKVSLEKLYSEKQ